MEQPPTVNVAVTAKQRVLAPDPGWTLLAVIPFVVLCLSRLDYFPMWDGLEYYNCVLEGTRRSLNPLEYNCFRHPTMAYLWPIALVEWIVHANYTFVILFNVALGVVGLRLFARLAGLCSAIGKAFSSGSARDAARVLSGVRRERRAAYAGLRGDGQFSRCCCCPRVGSRLVCGGMGRRLCVLQGNRNAAVLRSGCGVHDRLRSVDVVARQACLDQTALGRMAGTDVCDRDRYIRIQPTWNEWLLERAWRHIELLTPRSVFDSRLASMLAGMFALNFMWIPSVTIALAGAGQAFSAGRHKHRPRPRSDDRRQLWFILMLLAGCVVVLTRPQTFVNVKYDLPIYPLVLLLFYRCIAVVPFSPVRTGAMVATAVAFLTANVQSFDPVSARIFPFSHSAHIVSTA